MVCLGRPAPGTTTAGHARGHSVPLGLILCGRGKLEQKNPRRRADVPWRFQGGRYSSYCHSCLHVLGGPAPMLTFQRLADYFRIDDRARTPSFVHHALSTIHTFVLPNMCNNQHVQHGHGHGCWVGPTSRTSEPNLAPVVHWSNQTETPSTLPPLLTSWHPCASRLLQRQYPRPALHPCARLPISYCYKTSCTPLSRSPASSPGSSHWPPACAPGLLQVPLQSQ